MKPVWQLTDEQITSRLWNLAKGACFIDGKLFTSGNVQPEFDSTYIEIKRRGLPVAIPPIIHPADSNPILHNTAFVRYDKKDRLKELISGKVNFGNANQYREQENPAQRDDEVARASHYPDQSLKIGEITYPANNLIRTNHYGSATGKFPYYHFLSLTTEESHKLQRDFKAEGYILISDFDQFYETIHTALKKVLVNFKLKFGYIEYYDDLMPRRFVSRDDFEFAKSIHYKYQNEARIVLIGAPEVKYYSVDVVWPDGIFSEIREFR